MEIQVNIDCADPDALRAFYCDALGYRPHGRTRAVRVDVSRRRRPARSSCSSRCPSRRSVKNRVHLDLVVDDIEARGRALRRRSVRRGSSAEPVRECDVHWIVMLDPEGNEFCLCDA